VPNPPGRRATARDFYSTHGHEAPPRTRPGCDSSSALACHAASVSSPTPGQGRPPQPNIPLEVIGDRRRVDDPRRSHPSARPGRRGHRRRLPARRAGGFLLGRRTYEIFAAHWPNVSEEEQVLAEPLAWQNLTVLQDDVGGAVAALKQEDGQALRRCRSAALQGGPAGLRAEGALSTMRSWKVPRDAEVIW
jgi:hypothetical protein